MSQTHSQQFLTRTLGDLPLSFLSAATAWFTSYVIGIHEPLAWMAAALVFLVSFILVGKCSNPIYISVSYVLFVMADAILLGGYIAKHPPQNWECYGAAIGVATGLAVVDLLGMCVFILRSLSQAAVSGFSHNIAPQSFRHVHSIVLFMGLAAGIATALLVFLEKHRVGLTLGNLDEVTEALAPAVVSGTLIAVFVGVGSIVFLFEREIADILPTLRLSKDATDTVIDSVRQIRSAATMIYELAAKQDRTEKIESEGIRDRLVPSHATYFNSWVARIRPERSGQASRPEPRNTLLAAAIATTYWAEESADVARKRLVTNTRNYTAFLITLVTQLERTARDANERVFFYTSTPVSPAALLNWPHRKTLDGHLITYHSVVSFMNEYMLFIRDIVDTDRPIYHRRFIWCGSSASTSAESFASWSHYMPDKDNYGLKGDDRFLGLPIYFSVDSEKSAIRKEGVRCGEGTCGASNGGNRDDFNSIWPRLAFKVHPVLSSDEIYDRITKELEDSLHSKIGLAAHEVTVSLSQLEGKLKRNPLQEYPDEKRIWDRIAGLSPGTNEIPRSDETIVCLQHLEALFAANGLTLATVSELEQALLDLRWLQRWREDWGNAQIGPKILQSFPRYFDHVFHSGHRAEFRPLTEIDGDGKLNVCKASGPEFALIGLGPSDSTAFDKVNWLVALRSSISDPWESCKIEVQFSDDKSSPGVTSFETYVKAMRQLADYIP